MHMTYFINDATYYSEVRRKNEHCHTVHLGEIAYFLALFLQKMKNYDEYRLDWPCIRFTLSKFPGIQFYFYKILMSNVWY